MLSAALLVALFAALLAGVVTGLTGFGLALISTPILLFVYEPKTVVVEAQEIPLVLVPAAIAGKAIGTALLGHTSEKVFRAVTLGLVIMTGTLGVTTAVWALL